MHSEPMLVRKPEMTLAGLSISTSFNGGRSQQDIPPFFHKVIDESMLADIPYRINKNHLCVFKLRDHSPDFDYIVAVEVSRVDSLPEDWTVLVLAERDYAALEFEKTGHGSVADAFRRIHEEWLPGSEYRAAPKPAFVYYDEKFFEVFNSKGYDGQPVATAHVPVVRK